MMSLTEWAARWNIPPAALDELARSCIHLSDIPEAIKTEAFVQSQVRLEAAYAGVHLFRNNVGAGKLDSGNFVRFGLGNDSGPLNKVFKSADLVGVRRKLITAADVGTYIGQFVSRECKRQNWVYTGTPEELAQLKWATLINSQGGDAMFVTGPGTLPKT